MNTANRNYNENKPRRPALEQRRVAEPLNTAMRENLAILMRQSLQHVSPIERAPEARTNLGPVPQVNQDGVSHVNFGPSAKTQLGQILSFGNTLRFTHPVLEVEVPTMQHFWLFLQDGCRNRNIFTFNNDKLRNHIHKVGFGNYLPNQFALLAQAYWFKFQEHELLSELFVNVDAVYDYYIADARGRRRPVSAAYLVDIMKVLRKAMSSGRLPDFLQFLDRDVQFEMQDTRGKARVRQIDDFLAEEILKNLDTTMEPVMKPVPTMRGESTGYFAEAQGVQQQPLAGVPSATSMGLTYPEEVEAALANASSLTETLGQVNILKQRVDAGEDVQAVAKELGMEVTMVTATTRANVFETSLNADVKFGNDIHVEHTTSPGVDEDALSKLAMAPYTGKHQPDQVSVHAPSAPAAPSEPSQPSAPNEPAAPQAPAAPVAPGAQDDGRVIDFGGFKPVMATLTS